MNIFVDGYGNLRGWVAIVIVVGIITFIVFVVNKIYNSTMRNLSEQISSLGYNDIPDIQVFCRSIGSDLEDFIASKGLRKQYELFREGKSTGFIQQAVAHKQTDDAESNGLVTGLVVGIAAGNAMNSGR